MTLVHIAHLLGHLRGLELERRQHGCDECSSQLAALLDREPDVPHGDGFTAAVRVTQVRVTRARVTQVRVTRGFTAAVRVTQVR